MVGKGALYDLRASTKRVRRWEVGANRRGVGTLIAALASYVAAVLPNFSSVTFLI